MFDALQIKELVNRKPFEPFKIKMSDGSSYNVTNHDVAMVTRDFVEIGLDLDKNEIPGRITRCAIAHITTIEDAEKQTA